MSHALVQNAVAGSTSSLYPASRSAPFDPELFRSPTAAYRGAPFWSWNNRLDEQQLLRQIDCFKQMGLGGFLIHPRTGMATPYLGEQYLALVRACAGRAQREGLLCWLYDEDRWPSGYGGGLVTRDPALRQRYLLWTTRPYDDQPPHASPNVSAAIASRTGNGQLLARYEVVLRDGCLAAYHRLAERQPPTGAGIVWYAYVETATPVSWFNNQTYVDTLNPAAVRRFIEVTHECYRQTVGAGFGSTVPAIFTDEPQAVRKQSLHRATERGDITLPWTDDFPRTFAAAYGHRIEDALPELFWELPDRRPSRARYHYHDHVTERFAQAFADQLGAWCEHHGLALTGHMMAEATLQSQTEFVGEAMRSLRAFQIPGIDMLCDGMELTTAKQAQSVAHQYGREGVLSELYGVTNWDFDFVGHKAQGDWQAALGVTVRVPHLAWVSMAGEAKRDYPASIFYQSPWFREYPLIEDHFARVNVALTRGRPVVNVAVIHPIESYWLAWGPLEQTQAERAEREATFADVIRWLLFGLVDFDYLCEALLPELSPGDAGAPLRVGAMAYDAVVVPALRTIRTTTLERLERFAESGGRVIFVGEIPTLVDAQPSDRARRLAAQCVCETLSQTRLLAAVHPYRQVDVRQADGSRSQTILHQMRADGDDRYLFFCNTDRHHAVAGARIHVKGTWRATHLDTFTGERSPLAVEHMDGQTILPWEFSPHGHLLVALSPGEPEAAMSLPPRVHWREAGRLASPVPVTLSEPNVLLLDMAQWRLDDGPWQDTDELLRIENHVRASWDLPPRAGTIAQPWTDSEPAPFLGHVSLRFRIASAVAVTSPQLALENPAAAQVSFDGVHVDARDTGWWVDEAIRTIALPSFEAGEHELLLRLSFTRRTDIEWCYLLGDFGVAVAGAHCRLMEPVRELAFGDWTRQGLPFYAGNVTYHTRLRCPGGPVKLALPHFKAPLISVALDGRRVGPVAFAPFEVDLGGLAAGEHRVDLTTYGNRINSFGPLHNVDPDLAWFGPQAWRSEGRHYACEYQLKPMGILTAPLIYRPWPRG